VRLRGDRAVRAFGELHVDVGPLAVALETYGSRGEFRRQGAVLVGPGRRSLGALAERLDTVAVQAGGDTGRGDVGGLLRALGPLYRRGLRRGIRGLFSEAERDGLARADGDQGRLGDERGGQDEGYPGQGTGRTADTSPAPASGRGSPAQGNGSS
jgi:hypothetical protein